MVQAIDEVRRTMTEICEDLDRQEAERGGKNNRLDLNQAYALR